MSKQSITFYRIRNPHGLFLRKRPFHKDRLSECWDLRGKMLDLTTAESFIDILTTRHPEAPFELVEYRTTEIGVVDSTKALRPTLAYKRLLKMRGSTFDQFVMIAAKLERKKTPPKYICKVRDWKTICTEIAMVQSQCTEWDCDLDEQYAVTYMALADETALMKARLYFGAFITLYDYEESKLLEGLAEHNED